MKLTGGSEGKHQGVIGATRFGRIVQEKGSLFKPKVEQVNSKGTSQRNEQVRKGGLPPLFEERAQAALLTCSILQCISFAMLSATIKPEYIRTRTNDTRRTKSTNRHVRLRI